MVKNFMQGYDCMCTFLRTYIKCEIHLTPTSSISCRNLINHSPPGFNKPIGNSTDFIMSVKLMLGNSFIALRV